MAVQAPKNIGRKKESAYVTAAKKMLEFAVKEVHYYPEPEEVLDDERVDEGVDTSEDFIDNMIKHATIHNTEHGHNDKSLKCLDEMDKLLPEVVEKTTRGPDPNSRRTKFRFKMLDQWLEGYRDFSETKNQTEEQKHAMVTRLSLAWYLNARRFIYRSLEMRKPIKEDKRYKIGFLFHALRMNVFDQHKLFQGMQQQEAEKDHRNFETTLLIYTKILRMNVDLNDIISYLRLLHYNQPDPLLKSTWDFEHKRDPKNKKYTGIMAPDKKKSKKSK